MNDCHSDVSPVNNCDSVSLPLGLGYPLIWKLTCLCLCCCWKKKSVTQHVSRPWRARSAVHHRHEACKSLEKVSDGMQVRAFYLIQRKNHVFSALSMWAYSVGFPAAWKRGRGAFRKRAHGAHWVIRKGHILCACTLCVKDKSGISNIMWKSTSIFIGTGRLTVED